MFAYTKQREEMQRQIEEPQRRIDRRRQVADLVELESKIEEVYNATEEPEQTFSTADAEAQTLQTTKEDVARQVSFVPDNPHC